MTSTSVSVSDPRLDLLLERVPPELIWTNALPPDYRPAPFPTAALTLEPHGGGTRYVTVAMHRDEAARKQHEELGFHEGWGKSLDQLVAQVKAM